MGVALEEAPAPEAGGIRINGEAPIDGEVLVNSVIRDFTRNLRSIRGDHLEDEAKKLENSDIFLKVPNEKTGVPDQPSIAETTLQRDPKGPGFKIIYPEEVEVEPGRFSKKEKTVALSVTAGIVVLSSLYALRHKDK